MILAVIHGKTFACEYPELRDLAALKRNHQCMFIFQESTGIKTSLITVDSELQTKSLHVTT